MSDPKKSPSDSQIEKACFEERKAKAYNLVVIGIDILFEAAVDGNEEAGRRLEAIAEQVIQAAGDKNL
jgi:hypothetical protein